MTVDPVETATLHISTSGIAICAGDTVSFTALPVNGGIHPSYTWYVNNHKAGTDSSGFTISTLKDGDLINCLLTSSLPCTAPVNAVNTIAMTVKPVPSMLFTPDTVFSKRNKGIQLFPSVTGNIVQYQWTPAAGLDDPAAVNPVADPQELTIYRLVITADNGCRASGKIMVAVELPLQMPNAFTPNGDGRNDVFRIPFGVHISLQEFSVYNRWGGKVFTTRNISQGWDGTSGGQPAPAGTYVYVISGKNEQGVPVMAKGTVILIR
jgi:gliding motility-associated-like protein